MSVALNICGKDIKVLSINGRQVKKWGSAELPPGLVSYGLVLDTKAVGQAVNALFKSIGLPRDKVIVSVAGLPFTYRFLKLPRMKSSLLTEAIIRAARKEFSTPLDELYLSWQQLPDEDNELSFFVLGVPVRPVDAMLETLKLAGIVPYLMGLRPLALARTAERSDAIIVNMEQCCFDIVFMSGGIPRVIHTITPRSETATLEDNIHRLADELTKTATFYQSNRPDAQLDTTTPLLLTGDWADKSASVALLQAEIEYPIQPLIAHTEIPPDLPMNSYAALIGLAMKKTPHNTAQKIRDANFVDINVNILDGKYRKPKARPVPLKYVLTWLVLAVLMVLLYPLYQARADVLAENAVLDNELYDINRKITVSSIIGEENVAKENTIQSLITDTKAVNNAYMTTLGYRGEYGSNMETVTSLLPETAVYTGLEINHNEISVSGEADSMFTVIEYAAALDALGTFYDVRINSLEEASSKFSAATVTRFEIIIEKYSPAATQ
jgi:type IV pilus assembly protein PilM